MLRRIAVPSLAWIVLAALALAAVAYSAVQTTRPNATKVACTGYGYGYGYGYNTPTALSLHLSRTSIVARSAVSVSGNFTQMGCPVPNAQVQVQRRSVVNGVPVGSFTTFATRTTGPAGGYSVVTHPTTNKQYRAVAPAQSTHPAATSNTAMLTVHTRISLHLERLASCKVKFSGATVPAKRHRDVTIQRRKSGVWKDAFQDTTNSSGDYSAKHALRCHKTYRFRTTIAGDRVNAAGHSHSHKVRPHRH